MTASVYKWKESDKVVISDIDGTITKSDVMGYIFPSIGKDWTQEGVTKLYKKIHDNGYKFLYLSSRAIGQASMTKSYLEWVSGNSSILVKTWKEYVLGWMSHPTCVISLSPHTCSFDLNI